MSRHWKPPSDGKIVRIRPVGDWADIRSYRRHRLPAGAKAGLVIMAAACLGVAIGAYQAFGPREIVASEAEKVAITAFAEPDISDDEWEARGRSSDIPSENEAYRTGLPRADSARKFEVRANFSYCKWGGGTNCVVDGDTFYLNGAKVRIAGIDAPETHDYRCQSELELGERAARQLQALLNSGAVTMTSIDRDRDVYGRLLRNVSVNGRDVGEALISAGVARAYAGGRRPWC